MLPDRILGRAGDADRLVQRDVDVFATLLLRSLLEQRLVDAYLVALDDFHADAGDFAVDSHPALLDKFVRLAARTESGFADVFVEAHGVKSSE